MEGVPLGMPEGDNDGAADWARDGDFDGNLLFVMVGTALSAREGVTEGSEVITMIGVGGARGMGAGVFEQLDSGESLIGVFVSMSVQASSLV
jgi:hypothetical protein